MKCEKYPRGSLLAASAPSQLRACSILPEIALSMLCKLHINNLCIWKFTQIDVMKIYLNFLGGEATGPATPAAHGIHMSTMYNNQVGGKPQIMAIQACTYKQVAFIQCHSFRNRSYQYKQPRKAILVQPTENCALTSNTIYRKYHIINTHCFQTYFSHLVKGTKVIPSLLRHRTEEHNTIFKETEEIRYYSDKSSAEKS